MKNAAGSVNVVATEAALPRVTPPDPFMVRLFRLAEKQPDGRDNAEVLVKASVALPLLPLMLPEVRVMLLPE